MASPVLSAAEFKDRLAQDLPGALANLAPPASVAALHMNGALGALHSDDAVVMPARLPEVAAYLRDTLGYRYLSNITAVDYLDAGIFELVYHFYRLAGGPPLVVKLRLPRAEPVLPSLTPEWPGANLQEREAFDLYGITFSGHPFLRRVYMWDEFEGFPMRKDFPKIGDKYLAEGSEDTD